MACKILKIDSGATVFLIAVLLLTTVTQIQKSKNRQSYQQAH
jgi:hypothetical protein